MDGRLLVMALIDCARQQMEDHCGRRISDGVSVNLRLSMERQYRSGRSRMMICRQTVKIKA